MPDDEEELLFLPTVPEPDRSQPAVSANADGGDGDEGDEGEASSDGDGGASGGDEDHDDEGGYAERPSASKRKRAEALEG